VKILVTEHADHFTQLDYLRSVLSPQFEVEYIFRVSGTQKYWVEIFTRDSNTRPIDCKIRLWREYNFYLRIFVSGFRKDFIIVNTGPENESSKLVLAALFAYWFHRRKVIYTVRNPIKYSQSTLVSRRQALLRGLLVRVSGRLMYESQNVEKEIQSLVRNCSLKPSAIAYGRIAIKPVETLNSAYPTSQVVIGILGTVTSKRRDYDFLLKALTLLDDELKSKIRLCFLGSTALQDSSEWIKAFKKSFTVLENSSAWLSGEEFLSLGEKCDFLIAPLRLDSMMYGKGQSTGSFCDAIGLGKQLIIPSAADSHREFSFFSLYYEDIPELSRHIARLSTEKNSSLISTAIFERYSKDTVLSDWVSSVLKK
jgi:hypothetical protein